MDFVPAHSRDARPELAVFAAWLRARMRARRMSTNALARRIASSGSGVSEWMRAIRQPRVETLRRLAAEFDTPLEQLEAMLPDPDAAPPTISPLDLARAGLLLAAEGLRLHVPVETDDLADRTPPVVRGMVVWIDPEVPLSPGRVVAVEVAGERLLRSLAADGQTLHSAVAAPIPLAAVDRVLGVGRLAQLVI